MKTLLIISIFIVFQTMSVKAQKIRIHSEIDKFTKERIINVDGAMIYWDLFQYMGITYKAIDKNYYLIASNSGYGVGTIGTDDEMIFLLDNDSTVTVYSTGIQSYNIGEGNRSNSCAHYYRIGIAELNTLSNHNIKSIRKYLTDKYADFDVGEKRKDDLKLLTRAFLKELQKNQ